MWFSDGKILFGFRQRMDSFWEVKQAEISVQVKLVSLIALKSSGFQAFRHVFYIWTPAKVSKEM